MDIVYSDYDESIDDTRVYFGANNSSYSKTYTWKGYCGKSNILSKMVPRGGIEPPTQGFSVLCSTN